MSRIFFTFVLLFLLLSFSQLQANPQFQAIEDGAKSGFCGSKCGTRCSKAGMKERCLKYCGICCRECKCVPSGTYGNKHECPCYRDKVNKKGKPKCP